MTQLLKSLSRNVNQMGKFKRVHQRPTQEDQM